MSLDIDVLKKYAGRGMNVLLSGRHGVGKTAIMAQVLGADPEEFSPYNVMLKTIMDKRYDF